MNRSARHLVLHGLQDFQLLALRNAGRRQFGALEIAGDALVLAEENLLVHLLEVEGEVEGAAHARVLELVAPDVEGEGLHHADIADREFFQHHLLVAHGREIVGGRPVLGAVLGAPIDLVALERFQRDGGIAEIFVADCLEIIGADIQVEVLAPVVGDLLVDDGAAGREFLDAGRARSRAAAPAWSASRRASCRICRCPPTSASAAPAIGRRSAAIRGCRARRR